MKETLYERFYEIEDRHWWFRGRRAVLHGLISRAKLGPSPRILDAGCGTGRNLQEYAALGEAEGVEPFETAVEFCRSRGYAVRKAPLERLPYEDGSFDLACVSDVLEHVAEEGAALHELRRVVRPGGALVVTVPAYPWLWSHHDDTHHHVRRYTRSGLLRTARAGGFSPVFCSYFNSILLAPIALVRAAQRLRPPPGRFDYDLTPPALNAALELPLRAEARLLAGGRSLPAGLSVGLVCRAATAGDEDLVGRAAA